MIKEAEYEFNEGNYTQIPLTVFNMITGNSYSKDESDDVELRNVVVFENAHAYRDSLYRYDSMIDRGHSVYVSPKGQIFCFLREENKEVGDAATDTEEDKGE